MTTLTSTDNTLFAFYVFLHRESACLFLQALTTEVLNADSQEKMYQWATGPVHQGMWPCHPLGHQQWTAHVYSTRQQIYFPGHVTQEEVRFYLSSWMMTVRDPPGQSQLESVSQLKGFILV